MSLFIFLFNEKLYFIYGISNCKMNTVVSVHNLLITPWLFN